VGHRANLILVEGGAYRLFYSHWCANTLPRDLFWGPAHAAAFIRIQRAVDDSDWLEEVWAEGGAVLDLDRKYFLLYGGEDMPYDVPLRRVYLEVLAKVWKGWTVRWAYEGIADLADYVGYPRDRVLSKKDHDSTDGRLTRPEEKDWTDLVASVRFDDATVRLYPLAGDVASHVFSGSKMVGSLDPSDGLPQLLLEEWTTEFPSGGFHLDLPARRLEFWEARDSPDIGNRVARAWPSWRTQWHYDHYERQLERNEGLLRFPSLDRQALLNRCRRLLLGRPAASPVDLVQNMIASEREKGKDVRANPCALRDDRLELSEGERKTILDEIMGRL
jgi:hypothetical protein